MNAGFESLSMTYRSSKELLVIPEEDSCGFGRFIRPRCFQKYANLNAYLFVFAAIGVLQSAYFGYLIGIISTLEKVYAFNSQTTGLILIADVISFVFFSLFISYFCGNLHKPRLIAICMLLVVLSCFLSALPHFIYGHSLPDLSKSSDFLRKTRGEFCDLKTTEHLCEIEATPAYTAVVLLFTANFLNGFGHAAFYIVGVPYLSDNVKKGNSPVYCSKF